MTVVVSRETGGTTKPVGLLAVEPELQVLDAGSETELATSGLDPAFLADLLSACLAHERCGVHLYRSVAARTTIEENRQQYEHFGEETLEHVRILEELIAAAGGDPQYVSPAARQTERAGAGLVESTFVLAGSIDLATAELAMLEAVLLAEAKDHGNWELLARLTAQMDDGELRQRFEVAVTKVLAQEEEHYGWAREARTATLMLQAGADPAAMPPSVPADKTARERAGDVDGAGEAAEDDLGEMTRDELYASAKELDIPGRSSMTKDELARAIADREAG